MFLQHHAGPLNKRRRQVIKDLDVRVYKGHVVVVVVVVVDVVEYIIIFLCENLHPEYANKE